MTVRKLLLLLTLATTLVACDAGFGGMELNTSVLLDGSATTELGMGFIPGEDEEGNLEEIECSLDEDEPLPPGSTVRQENRGDEVWCILSIPTSHVQELQTFFDDLGEEIFRVNCLYFLEDAFIYDLDLFSGFDLGELQAEGTGYIKVSLTIPGPINSNNAHTQDGNTLTWQWSISSLDPSEPMTIQVNIPESGTCPGAGLDLHVFIQEDGAGWADLVLPIPYIEEDLEGRLVSDLENLGWSVNGVESIYDGPGQIKASRDYDSAESFSQIIQAVPGFGGSQAFMELTLSTDEASGLEITEYRSARWDMNQYAAYWQSLAPDTEVPAFTYTVDPPGEPESVSGNWTNTNLLEAYWEPGSEDMVLALSFRYIYDPDVGPYTAEEVKENLDVILDRFLVEIPAGQVVTDPSIIQNGLAGTFPLGWVNNWTGGGFACGDYQTRVLNWLHAIRQSDDPQVRALLKGLDYGPIQAYGGGHQAVVVFPRGTNWRETGTVLDPWPEQIPRHFSMEEWVDRFPFGIGPGVGAEYFPHLDGDPPVYRLNPLPDNPRIHSRQIGVNSPVTVMVVAPDGRRLGLLEDGTLLNEIPGADFYPTPKGDGTTNYLFGLPQGDYEVVITGTGQGEYHVMTGDGRGRLLKYPQQAITPAEAATLSVRQDSLEQPLISAVGAAIAPMQVTDQNVNDLEYGTPLLIDNAPDRSDAQPTAAPGAVAPTAVADESGSSTFLQGQRTLVTVAIVVLGLLGCLAFLAGLVVVTWLLLKRR